MARSIRLVVNETGPEGATARALLSIVPSSKGDVYLSLRCNDGLVEGISPDAHLDPNNLMREHRFSMHPSADSAVGISTITRTTKMANPQGDTKEFQWTRAIKNRDTFAPLFVRLCVDLSTNNNYKLKSDRPGDISLHSYDP